jgi:hypothetical protein
MDDIKKPEELTQKELDTVAGGSLNSAELVDAAVGAVNAWNNMQEIIGTGVSVKMGPGDEVSVVTK